MRKTQRRVQRKGKAPLFDKYTLYKKAVQSAETDVVFFQKVYKELKGKSPVSMREDFCGTFALSCEWIKSKPAHESVCVDLDPEPIEYGRNQYLNKLTTEQQKRIKIIEGDVLTCELPKTDISIALNFSYFVFKKREIMKAYFSRCYNSLKDNGVLIVDCFGGSLCHEPNEESTKHKDFTYYWEQASFNPVLNNAVFHIHFKPKSHSKVERVFTYDWRMWSLPELRDIMQEVGFKKTHVYWEGSTRKGTGNGIFTRTEKGEACQSWIAYIAAEK